MYYKDLTSYVNLIAGEAVSYVYPSTLNVGWLWPGHEFDTGEVSRSVIEKLRSVIFYAILTEEPQRLGGEGAKVPKLNLVSNSVRGPSMLCPWTKSNRFIGPPASFEGAKFAPIELGTRELLLPSEDRKLAFCFPDLVIHYIENLGYMPPQEFIDALSAFPIDEDFDADAELQFLSEEEVEVSTSDLLARM